MGRMKRKCAAPVQTRKKVVLAKCSGLFGELERTSDLRSSVFSSQQSSACISSSALESTGNSRFLSDSSNCVRLFGVDCTNKRPQQRKGKGRLTNANAHEKVRFSTHDAHRDKDIGLIHDWSSIERHELIIESAEKRVLRSHRRNAEQDYQCCAVQPRVLLYRTQMNSIIQDFSSPKIATCVSPNNDFESDDAKMVSTPQSGYRLRNRNRSLDPSLSISIIDTEEENIPTEEKSESKESHFSNLAVEDKDVARYSLKQLILSLEKISTYSPIAPCVPQFMEPNVPTPPIACRLRKGRANVCRNSPAPAPHFRSEVVTRKAMNRDMKRASRRGFCVQLNDNAVDHSIASLNTTWGSPSSAKSVVADLNNSMESSFWNAYWTGNSWNAVLRLCRQTAPMSWIDVYSEDKLESMRKLGEGVYGEVFSLTRGARELAVKIIPIEGALTVGGETQKSVAEVLSELLISRELTALSKGLPNLKSELEQQHVVDVSSRDVEVVEEDLASGWSSGSRTSAKTLSCKTRNFARLHTGQLLKGCFPAHLAKEWDRFAEVKGSDNQKPDFLPPDQLWLVLEYDFAGRPLDSWRFHDPLEAQSVLKQLAIALAVAERTLEFEHRDLHWGNVLVRHTTQPWLRYRLDGRNYQVATHCLEATIIDFTVSRLTRHGAVIYTNMGADEDIFVGVGDYQFDIYRMMRSHNGNDWQKFNPKSNIFWLHYLVRKLSLETSYPRRDENNLNISARLRCLDDTMLDTYESANDFVCHNYLFEDKE